VSGPDPAEPLAATVAERLGHRPGSWDVFAERIWRYELHLVGDRVEMRRGPLMLEGFGYREIRPAENGVHVGFAASTDLTPRGIARSVEQAERAGAYASFPAKGVKLPGEEASPPDAESMDAALWERPEAVMERYLHALLEPYGGERRVRPSFGSVRVSLTQVSIANSEGLETGFRKTAAEIEFAVRAEAGPEGRPRGEYWVNQHAVRLEPERVPHEVADWNRRALDAQRAEPTRAERLTVVLPPEVLSDILPVTLGVRLSGAGALRGMRPAAEAVVAGEGIELFDDGLFPYALATAPRDDEGVPERRRRIIAGGHVQEPLNDRLHAGALGTAADGCARRSNARGWYRFPHAPSPGVSTIVLPAGPAGSDAELMESVGEGLWLDQLGYAFPDPVSTAFGGEIRLAYRIRNGRLAEPVRGGTVGGVTLAGASEAALLRTITAIGSESRLVGRLSAPTVATNGLTVSGR
jgi:predicted Zn-dependent protease